MPADQFAPLLTSDYETPEEDPAPIFLESYMPFYSYRWSPVEALISRNLKYVFTRRPEVYDLAQDPLELHDLSGDQELRDALARRFEAVRDRLAPLGWNEMSSLDQESIEALESLGYTAGSHGEPSFDLPDGKDVIEGRQLADGIRALCENARRAEDAGKAETAERSYAEARALLDELDRIDPGGTLGAESWARYYYYQRKKRQAIPYLERLLVAMPRSAMFHQMLGECYRVAGEIEWAIQEYHDALILEPLYVPAYEGLGLICSLQGRYGEAVHYGEELTRVIEKLGLVEGWEAPPLKVLREQMRAAGQEVVVPEMVATEGFLPAGVLARGE
jgi:tetratricopeptide (TPR) repeat protein